MSQDDGSNRRQNEGKGSLGGPNFLWYMAGAVVVITVAALYLANLNVPVIDYLSLIHISEPTRPY